MNRLLNNLFVKIFVSFWVILVITALVSISLSKLVREDDFRAPEWELNNLQEYAERIERNPEHFLSPSYRPHKRSRFGLVFIVDQSGQVINQANLSRDMHRFILEHDDVTNPRVSVNDEYLWVGPWPIKLQHQDYLLYLQRRPPPEQLHAIRKLGFSPWFLGSVALLLSLLMCILLTQHIVQPLKRLRSAANKVSLGYLDTPLPEIQRGDEIGQLSDSLQRMVDTLNQTISNQQRLLSDISHELRSPLTRLNMALALHKKRQQTTPEIMRIERESQRLAEMINALLSLSRMQVNAKQQQTKFDELIADLINNCEFEAEQLNKQFSANYPKQLSLVCYPQLLSSAIENVCRNALKYADSKVTLKASVEDKQLVIVICDDGPGLAESELNSIFRPFYRCGEARDRDSGGVGLGLAIAESAVRQHGGSIAAKNHSLKGLEVSLRLPLQ
ncbi:ATP-binding protein [Agarivorans sp.]|uniref:ATP-binding protein n=1 Tax=Agarivorans sp. TaxID=1872412 RepID=UPI003D06F263